MKKTQLDNPVSLRVWFCVALVCCLLTIAISPLRALPTADQSECQSLRIDASITAINGTSVIACNHGEKLLLYSNMAALQGNYIEFTQGSLEEVTPDGELVRSIKLDGRTDWSPIAEADGIFSTVYSAEEKRAAGDFQGEPLRLNMLVTFDSRTEVSAVNCPIQSAGCESEVAAGKDILQFGFRVSNWEFEYAANRLRYRMDLKTREDTDFFTASASASTEVGLADNELTEIASENLIKSAHNVVQSLLVDVSVDHSQQNKLKYAFSVESNPAGHEFYF